MAENSQKNGLFGLIQTGIDISLGAAHKSIEMARNPPQAASKLLNDVMSMFTVPAHAGPELQDKAQAIAGVWMEKGMSLLSEFKTAGEKYKEGTKPAQES
jgi:hypothetical protein